MGFPGPGVSKRRTQTQDQFLIVCLGVESWTTAVPKSVPLIFSNSHPDDHTVI